MRTLFIAAAVVILSGCSHFTDITGSRKAEQDLAYQCGRLESVNPEEASSCWENLGFLQGEHQRMRRRYIEAGAAMDRQTNQPPVYHQPTFVPVTPGPQFAAPSFTAPPPAPIIAQPDVRTSYMPPPPPRPHCIGVVPVPGMVVGPECP